MCLAPEEDDEEWCEAGGITLIGEDEEVDMTLALKLLSNLGWSETVRAGLFFFSLRIYL